MRLDNMIHCTIEHDWITSYDSSTIGDPAIMSQKSIRCTKCGLKMITETVINNTVNWLWLNTEKTRKQRN